MPQFKASENTDGIMSFVPVPGCALAARTGHAAAQHETYKLAVVNAKEVSEGELPTPSLALQTAKIGRLSAAVFRTEHVFPDLHPLEKYWVGYCEEELWFWDVVELPMQLITYAVGPRDFTVHFNFSDHPDVTGVKLRTTSNVGYDAEREFPLDMMEISPETGLSAATMRSLSACTGFQVQAWPMMADGTLGLPTLVNKICTLPPVTMAVDEVGDKYLRISFQRPTWNGPLRRNVSEHESRIQSALLEVWEDPTPTLEANAKRLANGRLPQRYPLQRRCITAEEVPVGKMMNFVVSDLNPNKIHFIMLRAKTGTVAWDHPIRYRIRTSHELELIDEVAVSRSTLSFSWQRLASAAVPFCQSDVRFPNKIDLFDDREVTNPYVGENVVPLPPHLAWGHLDHPNTASEAYDVSVMDFATGMNHMRRTNKPNILVDGLDPSTLYYVRIRCIAFVDKREHELAPWSRPFLMMTPSDVLFRVLSRTTSNFVLGWGRHESPAVHPMAFPPGHSRYLPDAHSKDENADFFYYLEPLPFIPPSEGGDYCSDSEEEEDVFSVGSPSEYTGSRMRLLNRVQRREPLHDLPVRLVDDDEESVEIVVLRGRVVDEPLERLPEHNMFHQHVADEFAAKYEVVHRTKSSDACGQVAIDGLDDGEYTVIVFGVRAPDATGFRPQKLTSKAIVETLPSNCEVGGRAQISDIRSRALWSGLALETSLEDSSALHPEVSTVDLSEVFVTLRFELSDAAEILSSVAMNFLASHAKEDAVPAEYMVECTTVKLQPDGQLVPVGAPRLVYYSTAEETVQLIGLHAATQYHIRVRRMDYRSNEWSPWSSFLGLTTVQKLLMEVEDASAEYVKLRWNRQRMEDVTNFIVSLVDIHEPSSGHTEELCLDDLPEEFGGLAGVGSTPDAEDIVVADPAPGTESTPVNIVFGAIERRDDLKRLTQIITSRTRHRVALHSDLRLNGIFDCSVMPRYVNGQLGLPSNPARFLHCCVATQIVEIGVSHLFVEWSPVEYPGASNVTLILRLRRGPGWLRTLRLPVEETSFRFHDLDPLSEYSVAVSCVAVVTRHQSDPVDPRGVIKCAEPFALKGKTLDQPAAVIRRLGESCVELEWEFHAEEEHEGDVVVEIHFVDARRAEDFTMEARSKTKRGETRGKGTATVEGLRPERLYVVSMRQRYSKGTWGEWKKVLDGVSTLRRIEVETLAISETFFRLRTFRPEWTAHEGAHPSMNTAAHINPPKWELRCESMESGDITTLEVDVPEGVLNGLLPNTPYIITVRQWSISDWGEASLPLHQYTLQPLIPVVSVRGDSYLEILPSRDRKAPAMFTRFANPHDAVTTNQFSSIQGVKITATCLIESKRSPGGPVVETLEGSEAHLTANAALVKGLLPGLPYLVELSSIYPEAASYPESLATVTLEMPSLIVTVLGEDRFTVTWDMLRTPPPHYSAFSNLDPRVRHASREGEVAQVKNWQVKVVADEVPKSATNKNGFQNPAIKSVMETVESKTFSCSLSGLLPETKYIVEMRSIDVKGTEGAFTACGSLVTMPFAQLTVNKLAENFAEIVWDPPKPRTIFRDITMQQKRMIKARSANRDLTVIVEEDQVISPAFEPVEYELMVIDLSDPQLSDIPPTTIVPIATQTELIQNLKPNTPYAVIARARYHTKSGVVLGSWGPQAQFSTLALLVLKVVHVGLDFVNVTWQSVEEAKQEAGGIPGAEESTTNNAMQGSVSSIMAATANRSRDLSIPFPSDLLGSPTYFCLHSSHKEVGESATAVRFQLRVMEAETDGTIGRLKADKFVTITDDNIHTINELFSKTPYAVSMRVCYEGISGSWVDPAIVITDCVPDARVLKITQSSGEFLYRVEEATNHPRLNMPIPERRHRLYQITLKENTEYSQFSAVTMKGQCRLRVGHLKRDYLYHVLLREIVNGRVYGDYTHLTTFWTQPYPPIITELVECGDRWAHIRWGVMDNNRIGDVLSGDRIPPGFVYSLEKGIRTANNMGTRWSEIAITDVPNCRFEWPEPDIKGSLAKYCFRVRLSKLFVFEEGKDFKTPVWGDYSQLAVWNPPQPPGPVEHLRVQWLSDTSVVVAWDFPSNFQHQPGLVFNVSIDAARARVNTAKTVNAKPEWFFVTKTDQLYARIDELTPNSPFRVGVRGESAFGEAHNVSMLQLTTRSVPNKEPPTKLPMVTAAIRRSIKGIPPIDVARLPANNLHDKYEKPKQRRLKALSALAGITTRRKKTSTAAMLWKLSIKKVMIMQAAVKKEEHLRMLHPYFNPNEDLTPHQVARKHFGMDPSNDDLIWSKRHFTLREASVDDGQFPDMAIANTFGKMAQGRTEGVNPGGSTDLPLWTAESGVLQPSASLGASPSMSPTASQAPLQLKRNSSSMRHGSRSSMLPQIAEPRGGDSSVEEVAGSMATEGQEAIVPIMRRGTVPQSEGEDAQTAAAAAENLAKLDSKPAEDESHRAPSRGGSSRRLQPLPRRESSSKRQLAVQTDSPRIPEPAAGLSATPKAGARLTADSFRRGSTDSMGSTSDILSGTMRSYTSPSIAGSEGRQMVQLGSIKGSGRGKERGPRRVGSMKLPPKTIKVDPLPMLPGTMLQPSMRTVAPQQDIPKVTSSSFLSPSSANDGQQSSAASSPKSDHQQ